MLWPENSTAVDPFEDAGINADIRAGVARRSAYRSWSARWSTAGPEHVLNQGIVWDPDTGGGDRYTKRHPVPVRRVHPVAQRLPRATSAGSR